MNIHRVVFYVWMQCNGVLDFCSVASQNVFYKVLIKFAIDLWCHGVLILGESFVSNTFLRNIFLEKHFLISIIQRVPPVSLT